MQTKLSRYAEAVMEVCALAAVILVPLFFNVYSSRVFEPDKLTLLRSLAGLSDGTYGLPTALPWASRPTWK